MCVDRTRSLAKKLPHAGWMRRANRALLPFSHFGSGTGSRQGAWVCDRETEEVRPRSVRCGTFCNIEGDFDLLKTNSIKVSKIVQNFASIPVNLVIKSGWCVFQSQARERRCDSGILRKVPQQECFGNEERTWQIWNRLGSIRLSSWRKPG